MKLQNVDKKITGQNSSEMSAMLVAEAGVAMIKAYYHKMMGLRVLVLDENGDDVELSATQSKAIFALVKARMCY